MTDQIFYEELRATIRDAIVSYLDTYTDEELRELATESLNLSSLPTLADMTPAEREACKWTHADVKVADMTPEERPACERMHSDVILNHHVVILNHHEEDGRARVLWLCGCDKPVAWEKVTPRPDPPRMAWPSDQKSDN